MKKNILLISLSLFLSSCMFLKIPSEIVDEIHYHSENENKKENNFESINYFSNKNNIGPYSSAIKIGNYIFLSGQIGIVGDSLVSENILEQTEQSLKNISEILKNYNSTIEDVVSCTVYLKNIKDFSEMNNVYEKFFVKGKFPVRSTVEVSNLPKNAKIEISAIAYDPY